MTREASTEARGTYYSLEYRHGVDEKRRLSIPASWRSDGENGETSFYLLVWDKGGQPPCLLALPPRLMNLLMAKLDNLSLGDPESESLMRILGRGSALVTTDRAGRICLPEQLAKKAGIESEAVLVGMMNRFQIWNPKSYEAALNSDQVLREKAHKLI